MRYIANKILNYYLPLGLGIFLLLLAGVLYFISVSQPTEAATIAFVAQADGFNNNTAATATTTNMNCTGANFIVVSVADFVNTMVASTVTDTQGNSYAKLQIQGVAGSRHEALFYAKNATVSSSMAVNYKTNAGNSFIVVAARCYSGVDTVSPFDQQNGSVGSSTTHQTGSVTPTQNNELLVTGVMHDNGSFTSIDSGFTKVFGPGSGSGKLFIGEQIQTTATTRNPTWTFTLADPGPTTIATFKAQTAAKSVGLIIKNARVIIKNAKVTVRPR